MIKTEITEMFGVKYPIICGAMMWLCKPPFCAAISNAGAIGDITAANYETEETFRAAIHETRSLTDKAFTVSVTILPSLRITGEHYKMYLRVCAEEQVKAVVVSGAPIDRACGIEYVEMLNKAGVKLFHKVGSVRHARHAESVGYDGIFAAGIEEGGHPLNDDVTTMVLTPRIVEEINLPVVTVGGIANGKTMAAALMLGAQGVMMATRFLTVKECNIHDNLKKKLIDSQENDTTLICKSIGLQARALKNRNVLEVLDLEAKGASLEEIIPKIAGERISQAWETGDVDLAPLMVGQSVGLIHEVMTCKELVEGMMKEAEEQIALVSGKISNQ
ncbi:MAG TPA: nitronate monooxygenase [Syntrophales bacterium]|nr:nitronate monooxygenase [Syntrophales bacterium]HPQ44161.1 nitronate monooxygenase [Syntrophales bacterium]